MFGVNLILFVGRCIVGMIDYVNERPLEFKCKRFKSKIRRRYAKIRRREMRAHVMNNVANTNPYGNEPTTPALNYHYVYVPSSEG